jgi:hypothetical protein
LQFLSCTRQLLLIESFTHGEQLMMQRNFDGTDIGTGSAQAAGERQSAGFCG